MKIAIIQFPGSNCERETMLAVKRAGMEAIPFLWNEPEVKLKAMDGFILVGGFSYEDRSRAGIIAALDTIMKVIKEESEYGKPVLGICNGAQILVETGLVPGLENNKLGMTLTENKRMVGEKILGTGFYNAWVDIRLSAEYQRNAFTRHLNEGDIIHLPIAHAEGRFLMSDALLQEVRAQGLHVFQYCEANGKVGNDFPANPNGSLESIAAMANKAGNILAIMPHPERTTNGDAIFYSMRDYILEKKNKEKNEKTTTIPLYYYPRKKPLKTYQQKNNIECIVSLMITDNEVWTVQNTLRRLGFDVSVKKQIHWEISTDSAHAYDQIIKSGVLFNERKEFLDAPYQALNTKSFLVRAKENLLGKERLQMLDDHFGLTEIKQIFHGVLWHFTAEKSNINDLTDHILSTNIIYNPYAHECYHYSIAIP